MVSNRATNSASQSGVMDCPECSVPIGSADYSVICDFCATGFHHRCAGFTDPLYHSFGKLKSANLALYHCEPCKKKIADLGREVHCDAEPAQHPSLETNERLGKVEERLAAIVDTLNVLTGGKPPDETDSTEERPVSYAAAVSKGISNNSRVVTVADLHKVQEEESHRRSLVVAGLPERGQDFQDVSAICKLLDPSASVCQVFRMGRIPGGPLPSTQPPRPRLLKVHLPSSSVVKSILFASRKLKNSAEFRGVFLRRSMTKEERQNLSKIRTRCQYLNSMGTEEGVKYVVLSEKLTRFTGCEPQSDGRLVGGVRDRDWSDECVDEDLN